MYENMLTSKKLSLDIETFDPNLTKMGPGVYRSTALNFRDPDGYILGVSVVDEFGQKGYYNLGHYDCTEELRKKNLAYLKELLSTDVPGRIIIGANLLYDLDWLENWALIKVYGILIDVQVAETLLDENRKRYNLDSLGLTYVGEGKSKGKLEKFCELNNLKGDVRKWLWKMPFYMVEEYAIQDVDLPFQIWEIQQPMLIDQNLWDLMCLECENLRALLLMRKTGTRIDAKTRDENAKELELRVAKEHTHLINTAMNGKFFNFRSTQHLSVLFDLHDIPYPMTEKGNASITRDTLQFLAKGQLEECIGYEDGPIDRVTGLPEQIPIMQKITDPEKMAIGEELSDLRRADKVLKTFIHGSLVNFITKGDLIHASFYPTKTDDFGTRSGRFSSANPNLQQIPSKGVDSYYGGLSRSPFIPFDDCWWGKLDYSQIEYRFMAHFARGEGAEEVRAQYNANARTDYHQYIQDLTGLKRRFAKNLNFGVAYGMGAKHMSEFFQWELDYCYDILHIYHSNAPFIKSTIRAVEGIAKRRGYIKTFLKRRSRLLDPNKAYTMFCRLTQGSAADLMKKGMYKTYKAGIFDVLPPHITVHDEIDVSVPKTKEGIEAFCEAKHIMETCVKIKVPIIADMELGSNWADLEDIKGDVAYCKEELTKRYEGLA